MHPDLIISSPAVRAQKTAKGIGKLIGYDLKKIRTEAVIYFGTSPAILEMLQELDDAKKDVFLFGHEPMLSSLLFRLSDKQLEKFPTCGVCRLALPIAHWKDLQKGTCELIVFPKQLIK
jgi:phosphohistidine phosphatase